MNDIYLLEMENYTEILRLKELCETANEVLGALEDRAKYFVGNGKEEKIKLAVDIEIQKAYVKSLNKRLEARTDALQRYSELLEDYKRVVFLKRFIEGKTTRKIANELNLSQQTISNTLTSIRKMLKSKGLCE